MDACAETEAGRRLGRGVLRLSDLVVSSTPGSRSMVAWRWFPAVAAAVVATRASGRRSCSWLRSSSDCSGCQLDRARDAGPLRLARARRGARRGRSTRLKRWQAGRCARGASPATGDSRINVSAPLRVRGLMIDCIAGYHLNPWTCGIAKFNTILARHLNLPVVGIGSADLKNYGRPLLSLKLSEFTADDARALHEWVGRTCRAVRVVPARVRRHRDRARC